MYGIYQLRNDQWYLIIDNLSLEDAVLHCARLNDTYPKHYKVDKIKDYISEEGM